MNTTNDSVIICDSPSPAKTKKWMDSVMTDYKKRLRSISGKSLLATVYESPLMHFKRNKIAETDTILELNDVTIVSSPLAKERKTKAKASTGADSMSFINLDESVVIVNETIPAEPAKENQSVVELGLSDTETNDVVEVPEPSSSLKSDETSVSSKAKKNRKSAAKQFHVKLVEKKTKKARKKVTNPKNPRNLKIAQAVVETLNVNDENHDGQIMENSTNGTHECPPAASGDAGDVEVVWASGPETVSQRVGTADQPFVIDTVPSLTNVVNAINLKPSKKRRRLLRGEKQLPNDCEQSGASSKFSASAHCQEQQLENQNVKQPGRLREIVIDGPNVGMGFMCGKCFSEKGLKLVIDYFKRRGHVVKAFLPQTMRARDRVLLEQLHREGTVVFTPSRFIGGRMITPYDDRYILDYATQCEGIVISSDQYRDLWHEKPQWRNTIENRLLAPTFAGDYLMFPEDPLGRSGPKLDEFLRY